MDRRERGLLDEENSRKRGKLEREEEVWRRREKGKAKSSFQSGFEVEAAFTV